MMKYGINGLSMFYAPIESDFEVTSKLGYEYLEIWWPKIGDYLKNHTLSDLAADFKRYGVKPANLTSIEEITFRDKAGKKELEELVHQTSEVCQAVGCPLLEVVPSKMIPGLTRQQIVDETADVLNELSEIVKTYGIKLSFEFVGAKAYTVNSLELCLEIMKQVDSTYAGIVVDTFHFHNSKSPIDLIRQAKAEQIVLVHLADGEDVEVSDLSGDKYRLLPGDGVVNIRDILIALRDVGYKGVASFETIRPEHHKMDPMELASQAKEKVKALYSDLVEVH